MIENRNLPLRPRALLAVIIFLSFTGFLKAWEVLDFSAFPKTNVIEIRWEIRDGADIQTITLQKSLDDNNWQDLKVFSYLGDGAVYEFQDTGLSSKTDVPNDTQTTYYYRLKITKKDGTVEYSASIIARPSYSGIQRTWGSLKALFR